MEDNVVDQLVAFERNIGEIARDYISPLISKIPASQDVKSQLVDQLTVQAVQRSREMLGPILVSVRAEKLTGQHAQQALVQQGLPAIMDHWQNFLHARCDAIHYQLENISRVLTEDIVELQVMDGDPHNGALQPLRITTNSIGGSRDFLYKSIDATPMKIVHRIAKAVCEKISIENFVDDVAISTDDFYLRNFSAASKPTSKEEIEQYYYAFGAIVSVSSALEISDLHFENLIATRNGPKIIDIEFILSNTQYQNSKWSYKNSGLFEPETSPVAQMHLHQHISPTYRLINGKVQYSHLEGRRSDLHVLYDDGGKPLEMRNYTDIMSQGACDADKVIKADLPEFYDTVRQVALQDHKIRCWIRGTAYYRVLQIQLWLPGCSLKDRIHLTRTKLESKNAISSKISQKTKKKIIDAELYDLLKGDIPYFWINGKNGSLMHSTGLMQESFGLPTAEAMSQRYTAWKNRSFKRDMRHIVSRMLRDI